MDAMFLQDSLDPKAQDPAHWAEVKRIAVDLGLHLETGGGKSGYGLRAVARGAVFRTRAADRRRSSANLTAKAFRLQI
jgi:hypothetical protein